MSQLSEFFETTHYAYQGVLDGEDRPKEWWNTPATQADDDDEVPDREDVNAKS